MVAAWNDLPPTGGLPESVALVELAERLRWSAPELVVLYARRALVEGGAAGGPAMVRAQALLAGALARLGRHAEAIEPAMAALRAADQAGVPEFGWLVRLDLAACARALGEPMVGCVVLRPVLDAPGSRPATRAGAISRLVGCTAHVGRRDDLEDSLAEADRLLAADDGLTSDARRLERALLAATTAAYHRRYGETEDSVEVARDGLGLLARLRDPKIEGGRAAARLVMELVFALLDEGHLVEAEHEAGPVITAPVRAASAPEVGRLLLAVATRVLLPDGRVESGRGLLDHVTRIAERHGHDWLLADALTAQADLDERAAKPADALHALRAAHAAEHRHRRAVTLAKRRLMVEFGLADLSQDEVNSLLRGVVRAPVMVAPPVQTTADVEQGGPDPVPTPPPAALAGRPPAPPPEPAEPGSGETDAATGLLTREGLSRRLAAVRRGDRPVALTLVRLHPVDGDGPDPAPSGPPPGETAADHEAPVPDALTTLAGRVRDIAPEDAELARSDGSELAVLLPHTTREAAEELAATIRESAIESDWLGDASGLEVSISTGVAQSDPGAAADEDADTLLSAARETLIIADRDRAGPSPPAPVSTVDTFPRDRAEPPPVSAAPSGDSDTDTRSQAIRDLLAPLLDHPILASPRSTIPRVPEPEEVPDPSREPAEKPRPQRQPDIIIPDEPDQIPPIPPGPEPTPDVPPPAQIPADPEPDKDTPPPPHPDQDEPLSTRALLSRGLHLDGPPRTEHDPDRPHTPDREPALPRLVPPTFEYRPADDGVPTEPEAPASSLSGRAPGIDAPSTFEHRPAGGGVPTPEEEPVSSLSGRESGIDAPPVLDYHSAGDGVQTERGAPAPLPASREPGTDAPSTFEHRPAVDGVPMQQEGPSRSSREARVDALERDPDGGGVPSAGMPVREESPAPRSVPGRELDASPPAGEREPEGDHVVPAGVSGGSVPDPEAMPSTRQLLSRGLGLDGPVAEREPRGGSEPIRADIPPAGPSDELSPDGVREPDPDVLPSTRQLLSRGLGLDGPPPGTEREGAGAVESEPTRADPLPPRPAAAEASAGSGLDLEELESIRQLLSRSLGLDGPAAATEGEPDGDGVALSRAPAGEGGDPDGPAPLQLMSGHGFGGPPAADEREGFAAPSPRVSADLEPDGHERPGDDLPLSRTPAGPEPGRLPVEEAGRGPGERDPWPGHDVTSAPVLAGHWPDRDGRSVASDLDQATAPVLRVPPERAAGPLSQERWPQDEPVDHSRPRGGDPLAAMLGPVQGPEPQPPEVPRPDRAIRRRDRSDTTSIADLLTEALVAYQETAPDEPVLEAPEPVSENTPPAQRGQQSGHGRHRLPDWGSR